MQWLIDEVFSPAMAIAQQLAARDQAGTVSGFFAPAAESWRLYARLKIGLQCADRELQGLPAEVAAEVRGLQRILNGAESANGNISLFDAARYLADSELGLIGKRGWSAVVRQTVPLPFPDASPELPTEDELNTRARDYLRRNPTASGRSVGPAIGCSITKGLSLPPVRAVVEKRKSQCPKAPKAVSLTAAMAASIGVGGRHEVLSRLTAEQEADQRDDNAPRNRGGNPIGRRRKA
jgi:hypothetical protein